MAVIAYDRYNVIVRGMSGTRMTTSKHKLLLILTTLLISKLVRDRTGNYLDRTLLDIRHLLVYPALLWIRPVHSRRDLGLVLVRLSYT